MDPLNLPVKHLVVKRLWLLLILVFFFLNTHSLNHPEVEPETGIWLPILMEGVFSVMGEENKVGERKRVKRRCDL